MKGKKGFTLIELLMVIAVIAVLMSILIPALGKVRALARVLVCQSNLRQWGFMWDMYTQKNNGLFDIGYHQVLDADRYRLYWPWTLRNYYDKLGGGITCCPMANNPNKNFEAPDGTFGPRSIMEPEESLYIPTDPFYSSYGQNWWTWNRHPNFAATYDHKFWKKTGYKQANNIPVFMDARNVVLSPDIDVDHYPPQFPEDIEDEAPATGSPATFPICMKAAFINRHNNWHTDVLFMDWSVKKVLLKGLWDLYWSRDWAEKRLRRIDEETWPPVLWESEDYNWIDSCPDVDYGF